MKIDSAEKEAIWDEIYSLELRLSRLETEISLIANYKEKYTELMKIGEITGEIKFRLWELYNMLYWLQEDIDLEEIKTKYLFG